MNPSSEESLKLKNLMVSMADVVDFARPNRTLSPSGMPQFQGFPLNYEPSTPYTTPTPRWRLSEEERFQQFTTELVEKFLHKFLRNKGIEPPSSGRGRSSPPPTVGSLRLSLQNSSMNRSLRDQDVLDRVAKDLLFLVEDFERPYNLESRGTESVALGEWFDGGESDEWMQRRFELLAGDVYRERRRPGGGRCVRWGRIVAHFCFVAHLAVEGVQRGRERFVELVAQWMSDFLTRELRTWITEQGGWAGLIRYRSDIGQWGRWEERASSIMYSMGAVALVGLFGLVMAKKYLRSP